MPSLSDGGTNGTSDFELHVLLGESGGGVSSLLSAVTTAVFLHSVPHDFAEDVFCELLHILLNLPPQCVFSSFLPHSSQASSTLCYGLCGAAPFFTGAGCVHLGGGCCDALYDWDSYLLFCTTNRTFQSRCFSSGLNMNKILRCPSGSAQPL